MKKQMNKFVSLTLAIAMLLSLTVMPQISANETEATEEILVWSDFEYDKGGFMGQYDNGAATGGVDRVYTDASHGKSFRIYSKSPATDSNTNQKTQRAFLNLPEAVSTGKLHISYEAMTDTPELSDVEVSSGTRVRKLESYLMVSPTAQADGIISGTDDYKFGKLIAFGNGMGGVRYVNGNMEYGYRPKETNEANVGEWYQIDAIIDFDNGRTATFYRNGVELGSTTLSDNITAIQNLTFNMWSFRGSIDPVSLYIDNLKIAKLGTQSDLSVASYVIGADKKSITLNLSETVGTMPELSAENVSVIKRGSDASENITAITATGKNITIALENALLAGMEYEVYVDADFIGIAGASAMELCEYVYVEKDEVFVLDEGFETQTESPFLTTYGSGDEIKEIYNPTTTAEDGTVTTSRGNNASAIEDYTGRGKVHVVRNTELAPTNDYQLYAGYYVMDEALDPNKKYVISYSNMINSNESEIAGGSTRASKIYPGHLMSVTNRANFSSYSPTDYKRYTPGTTRGYIMALAQAGKPMAAGLENSIASYAGANGGDVSTVNGRAATYAWNTLTKYTSAADEKYTRYNKGEWYETTIVLDMANTTADYYWDGKYVGTQTAADGLDFKVYASDGSSTLTGLRSLVFFAGFGSYSQENITQRGVFMLDDIKIKEYDDSAYVKSIRFADEDGNESFSKGTVSTLNTKIKIKAENTESLADMGVVTLTAKGVNDSAPTDKNFAPSYENGVYTIDLGGYLPGNTEYVLTALGTEYKFKTDAGGFKVESVEISKNGTVLENLNDVKVGDKIRVTVNAVNTTGAEQSVWMSGAFYNGNTMNDVIFKTLKSDGKETIISDYVELTIDDVTGLKVSGFAWDNSTTMKPLIKNTELSL